MPCFLIAHAPPAHLLNWVASPNHVTYRVVYPTATEPHIAGPAFDVCFGVAQGSAKTAQLASGSASTTWLASGA